MGTKRRFTKKFPILNKTVKRRVQFKTERLGGRGKDRHVTNCTNNTQS